VLTGDRMGRDCFEESVTNGMRLGWVSSESHLTIKRMNALRNARQKMDQDSQDSLPPMVIFMPALSQGQTMRREILPDSIFLYLSFGLEWEHQVNVDFVVAHELAHVVLGHGKLRQRVPGEEGLPHELTTDERAATEMVTGKWKIPKLPSLDDSIFLRALPLPNTLAR